MFSIADRKQRTKKVFRWQFAQVHPVLTFLLITFVWTWLFWLAVIPLRGKNDLLLMLIVFIGGYGPAIGAILTLGLKNGLTLALSRQQLLLLTTAATIFGLMIVRYWVGIIPGYDRLPENLTLSGPILVAALAVCLVGGWVIANALSNNITIREKMASLLPVHLPWRWTLFALFFFPVLLLLSWGIGSALGQTVEFPALWTRSLVEVIPLFLLAFTLTIKCIVNCLAWHKASHIAGEVARQRNHWPRNAYRLTELFHETSPNDVSMKTEPIYKPVHFFLITFLLTWIGGFIAAHFSYQPGKKGLHGLFMLPGLFAPVIAALILVRGDSLLFGYTESSLLF